jgi:Protein of unknown function (DUF1592)/Protein of unknown function (DUF1588)/Protein of unknown function (DUF1587)/Protein of unknown function (DUF1595)/Protein of unknown function (DUF1585)
MAKGRGSWGMTWFAGLACCALAVACSTGDIEDPGAGGPLDSAGAGAGAKGANGDDGFFGGDGSGDGTTGSTCRKGDLPTTTRLPRLTHAQYDNTVRDLFGLDAAPSSAFLNDPTFDGFDNSAEGLVVSDRLGRDYRRAAEQLAAQIVADSQAYGQLVTCTPSVSTCASDVVTALLRRTFRRPATSQEVDRYVALHAQGAELLASGDAFKDGVQLVLEAALQSPNFLYRTELSRDVGDDGYVSLTDHEVASRLSYALWNTMPDTTLADAADAGELRSPAQVATQARRMLGDPKAKATVADFHRQWLDLASYEDLLRDETEYPLFSADLAKPMQDEALAFVDHVTFEMNEGLHTLLTAPFTFVNAQTAPLYGLTGDFGDELERVELDPTQRGGLLTQVGFLASHAFISTSSPIHRGVFVHRRVLCSELPDPPGNANLKLPPITGDIKTTRQQVEVHTSAKECQVCHGIINPTGFAFEHYDAVGQYRTTDHGETVDATGELTIDGETVTYKNAMEFTEAVADSDAARGCYATQWLRYVYGRSERAVDDCTVESLTTAMRDGAYSTQDMLTDLVQTRAFLQRAPEAAP